MPSRGDDAIVSDDRTTAAGNPVHDVVIIGSGPAGYTAALYAARGFSSSMTTSTFFTLVGLLGSTFE